MPLPKKRRLDDWLDSYLEYTEDSEPPDIFHLWCGISCLAGALERKVWVQLGPVKWYPNMFISLIAPPGKGRKSTAIQYAQQVLTHKDVDISYAAQAGSVQALIDSLKASEKSIPLPGGQYFHSSVTARASELTVLFSNEDTLQFFAAFFDSPDEFIYKTIGRGEQKISGLYLNILGATTPQLIQKTLPDSAAGGGLLSRFIFVYAQDIKRVVPIPVVPPKMMKLLDDLSYDLAIINQMYGPATWEEEATEVYIDWRYESHQNPKFTDDLFASYESRRPTHLGKLAMILAVSGNSTNSNLGPYIRKVDIERAIKILDQVEVQMQNAFFGYASTDLGSLVERCMVYAYQKKTFLTRELYAEFYSEIDGPETIKTVLATMVRLDFIKLLERDPKKNTVRWEYNVNNSLHAKFTGL